MSQVYANKGHIKFIFRFLFTPTQNDGLIECYLLSNRKYFMHVQDETLASSEEDEEFCKIDIVNLKIA